MAVAACRYCIARAGSGSVVTPFRVRSDFIVSKIDPGRKDRQKREIAQSAEREGERRGEWLSRHTSKAGITTPSLARSPSSGSATSFIRPSTLPPSAVLQGIPALV